MGFRGNVGDGNWPEYLTQLKTRVQRVLRDSLQVDDALVTCTPIWYENGIDCIAPHSDCANPGTVPPSLLIVSVSAGEARTIAWRQVPADGKRPTSIKDKPVCEVRDVRGIVYRQ